ncbi:hypothetical protein NCAS_0H01960 [Naumovozyma castellii]|uniref:Uncharacterized protein n=1 Tax=Naumovozyma castellii TaxID=27288 RepID=G0VJ28_NAUCA|nr:hypothetical protein NCAS_0H01960 [Naumovozyma castellii CBS 4309]CCC71506.1 hypothetical protein NCAS_0H01960 [Naumovozyma castellii CBS 4309]
MLCECELCVSFIWIEVIFVAYELSSGSVRPIYIYKLQTNPKSYFHLILYQLIIMATNNNIQLNAINTVPLSSNNVNSEHGSARLDLFTNEAGDPSSGNVNSNIPSQPDLSIPRFISNQGPSDLNSIDIEQFKLFQQFQQFLKLTNNPQSQNSSTPSSPTPEIFNLPQQIPIEPKIQTPSPPPIIMNPNSQPSSLTSITINLTKVKSPDEFNLWIIHFIKFLNGRLLTDVIPDEFGTAKRLCTNQEKKFITYIFKQHVPYDHYPSWMKIALQDPHL